MEHLQNAELHENINSVTFGDSLESVNKPKPHKEVCPYMPIRLVRTDTYGHSSQALAVQPTLCGSPRERQVVGCTYYNSAFNEKKDKEGTA